MITPDAAYVSTPLGRKAFQALGAARTVFLENGYDASTMDAIARASGISKATLYAHFSSKEKLFEALIRQECRAISDQIYKPDANSDDIAHELLKFARNISIIFTGPYGPELYRILVPVAPRFPRLARVFYDEGPNRGLHQVADFLRALCEQGRLEIPDVHLAAEQFLSLMRGDMDISGALALPPRSPQAVEKLIGSGVAMLLDHYKVKA